MLLESSLRARTAFFKHAVYPLTDGVFRRDSFGAFREISRLETLSRDRLAAYQVEQLRELLTYSRSSVPYYRSLLEGVDLRPSAFTSLKDLSQVPVLTKTLIRENGQRLLSEQPNGPIKAFPTSGSTGTPLVVHEDQGTNGWRRALKWKYLHWWDVQIGDRGAVVWLQPLSGRKAQLIKRAGFSLNNCNTFLNVADLSEAQMSRFWHEMISRRVSYLYGYTSALTTLARFAVGQNLHRTAPLSLKVVVPTTETLFAEQRALMRAAFGVQVANEYGCAELGDIAFECPEGCLHIAAHTYIVEVGPPFLPTSTGVCGQIIVTHLRNRAMPLIRYALGDIVHLVDKQCPCGRDLPVIQSVEGRISDIITTPNGRVLHTEVFDYVMREFASFRNPAVILFRAIQHAVNDIEVLIVPGSAYGPETSEGIRNAFARTFGEGMQIRVTTVDSIPPDPSGKLRFFLSKIPVTS